LLVKKNTHAHTIDIHVKKREREREREEKEQPNKVTENITNNTQKKKKKKDMMTMKQAHIREKMTRSTEYIFCFSSLS
jgi:hypothetical protein